MDKVRQPENTWSDFMAQFLFDLLLLSWNKRSIVYFIFCLCTTIYLCDVASVVAYTVEGFCVTKLYDLCCVWYVMK